jgi:predicted transcriptional regulator
MGRLPTGDRKYEITHIWDRHKEIMRLLVAGLSQVDIAKTLGVTPVMVSYTANSAICRRQMALMHAAADLDAVDVAKRIQEIAPVALDTLEKLLCEGNETTQFKVATDLLDRAGHGAVKSFRMEHTAHLSRTDIEEIKQRAKEIGICHEVIEGEVEDLASPKGELEASACASSQQDEMLPVLREACG